MDRRTAVKLAASSPLLLTWSACDADEAARQAQAARAAGGAYLPKFFNEHEWQTVRTLVDLIIPADERSGSATDAGVPEFMDFLVSDQPGRQTAMRGGLAWIDTECRERFGRSFLECAADERGQLLDDIAWPKRARPEFAAGVAFFNRFRDLTAAGFWSSRVGIDDLQYTGNTVVPQWTGCPPEALSKLGVSYDS
jgi:Gluconate 2-dehydrogenase subunit 3